MNTINKRYSVDFILSFKDKNKKLPNINKKFIVKFPNKKKIKIKHNISNPWISSIEKKNKKNFNVNQKIIEFLNIISVSNFDIIVNNFKKIFIRDLNCLKNIVNLIYSKTILEENYIDLYINLVMKIKNIYPKMTHNNKKISFITLFIDNINNNFTNWNKIDLDNLKEKQLVINNILLIAKLFNKKILTNNVINSCIDELLNYDGPYNNFAIELVCKMIKIIYENYEKTDKNTITRYIDKLKNINDISSKNKFLLMDILDFDTKENTNDLVINEIKDNKIANIFLEYFNNLDTEELLEYYVEYRDEGKEEIFYENMINTYIETNKENKEYLTDFIKYLIENKFISTGIIKNNLTEINKNISEYKIDFPNVENDINYIKRIIQI